jgi:hypothetical protein
MPHALLILRLTVRICASIFYALFIGPWVALSAGMSLVNRVDRYTRMLTALRSTASSQGRCPRGCRSELRGVWECRACGSLFAGFAFQACPVCSSTCGHIACEHCGLAIRNPFV